MNLFAVISISVLLSVFLPGGLAQSRTGPAELYVGLPSQPLDDDMQDSEEDDGVEDSEDDEGEYYEDDDEASEEDGNDSFDEWYDNGDQEDYGEDD
jgi:hypothetical protein